MEEVTVAEAGIGDSRSSWSGVAADTTYNVMYIITVLCFA
jgi:hypothetical protein